MAKFFTHRSEYFRAAVYPVGGDSGRYKGMVNSKLIGRFDCAQDAIMGVLTSDEVVQFSGSYNPEDWSENEFSNGVYPSEGEDQ